MSCIEHVESIAMRKEIQPSAQTLACVAKELVYSLICFVLLSYLALYLLSYIAC